MEQQLEMARQAFSMAWLIADGNFVEGGLAKLIGNGLKKVVYY
jgi:hypothetical protein